ncbi:MAG: hypothetical protein OEP48_16635 [Betaproteobacteria bacterium]|nr:hypothetical protein [Betaproteobacteria bacterium]MDH3438572.1 hypothetical protein [Betaproteobacteria bacterium]
MTLRRVGAAGLFFAILATPAQADPPSELAQARHDLAISEQVLARVSERVEIARSDPATAPAGRRRLDEYLARVRDLVELNRERVRLLAQTVAIAPAGAPAGETGDIGVPAAATQAEEVAALDAKLGGSLAEFDQLLLEEARKARARAPTRASAGGYGAGSNGDDTGTGTGTGAQKSGAEESSTTGVTASRQDDTDPGQSAGKGPGSPGGRIEGTDPGAAGPTAAVPPDVGDGNDDDIVARQIRKAAEAETDPELRKKLWDEYRRYKQGTKG